MSEETKQIEGNKILESHVNCDFPVFLVEITNEHSDEIGKFAVVKNCGWNPLEGWHELDFRYFTLRADAEVAYDKEVSILAPQGENK